MKYGFVFSLMILAVLGALHIYWKTKAQYACEKAWLNLHGKISDGYCLAYNYRENQCFLEKIC